MKTKESVALVTGASSGIGEATAHRLAAAGYKVFGTSRRGASAKVGPFAMLALDVTSEASIEALVKEVIRLQGRIDLLVNNAGFGVAPPEEWRKVRSTRRERSSKPTIRARWPHGYRDPTGPGARCSKGSRPLSFSLKVYARQGCRHRLSP